MIYFVLWPTNTQLFHKLSHFYMFRHYCVILRQSVINTLPSYTNMSNAAVGNTVYSYDVLMSGKSYQTWVQPFCVTTNVQYVKHLKCKLYYQQLYLKYLCNLARHWIHIPWRWHDSVETCRNVVFCEIIVHLLATVQNNKRRTVHR